MVDKKEDTDTVKSVKPRHKYSNDVLAFILIVSLVAFQGYAIVYQDWGFHYMFIIVVLASATWLFGIDLIKEYKKKT